MIHNRYLKNRFAAVSAVITAAKIALNSCAKLAFHALDYRTAASKHMCREPAAQESD